MDQKGSKAGLEKYNIDKECFINHVLLSEFEFLETIGVGKYFIN